MEWPKRLNARQFLALWPNAFLLVGMIFSGSRCMKHLSIGSFLIFKNMTTVLIALAEMYFFSSKINWLMVSGFSMIVGASVLGGYADITVSRLGLLWMVANVVLSAAHVIALRLRTSKLSLGNSDTAFYTNLMSVPLMLILSVVFDQWRSVFGGSSSGSSGGLLSDGKSTGMLYQGILSGFCAFAISYSTAWCIRVLSSTTYSIAGALNKLPITIVGMLFFPVGDGRVSLASFLSVAMSFMGGLFYTAGQLSNRRRQQQQKQAMPSKSKTDC